MVRGNWQRRVEQTEARRALTKAQKERRRANTDTNKQRSSSIGGEGDRDSMWRGLERWLETRGGSLADLYSNGGESGGSGLIVDVWTDVRPSSRREYLPQCFDESMQDDDDDSGNSISNSNSISNKSRSKKDRGGFHKKGRQHPNARKTEKSPAVPQQQHRADDAANSNSGAASASMSMFMCPREFYHGREKCPKLNHKKGGRSRSNSVGDKASADSCKCLHYHDFPKAKIANNPSRKSSGVPESRLCNSTPPLTLERVVNAKYSHPKSGEDDEPAPTPLPAHVREIVLRSARDAAASMRSSSRNAPPDSAADEGGVEMVYHSRIVVGAEKEKNDADDRANHGGDGESDEESSDDSGSVDEEGPQIPERNDKSTQLLRSALQDLLTDENLSPLNVVYFTIQGMVIYDIHQGGLLPPSVLDAAEKYLICGEAFRSDFGRSDPAAAGDAKNSHAQLTHHVLDEIALFSNDESAAVLPRVCKVWREEVGTRSPHLWRGLLDRRGWIAETGVGSTRGAADGDADSGAREDADGDAGIECRRYREAFVSHYLAARDARAVSYSCHFLLGKGGGGHAKPKDGIEYAVQTFKATKGAPAFDAGEGGRCTVKVWPSSKGTSRALAAYGNDCTLRLFEAVPGNRTKCRQIVCVRASPPSVSRKKDRCELLDMDLDDDVVASLVVEGDEMDGDAEEMDSRMTPWLTVVPREELICAGNEGILSEESIHSQDARAAVLDFIMGGSSSVDSGSGAIYDSMREPLHQYLSVVDGDTSDVLISITPKIVACGKGNFLLHASISIPGYSLLPHEDDDSLSDDEARLQRLQHIVPPNSAFRLFILSTQRGGQIIHSIDAAACLGLYASRPFKRRMSESTPPALCTNVAIQNPTKIVLLELSLKRDGTFDVREDWIQSGILRDKCPIALSQTHMFYGMGGAGRLQIKVHDIAAEVFSQRIFAEFLHQDLKLHNIVVLNENYVVAIVGCATAADENEDEAFDGHWFGSEDVTRRAIVYHIPSCQKIHECSLPDLPLSLDAFGGTLAFNVGTLGFVIAGASARDVRNMDDVERMPENDPLSSPSGKNPKGKKKRLASKTAKKDKKDGFARGMSLRG